MGQLSLPPLATGRLHLEPAGRVHLPLLVELNSDPEVMRHLLGRAATPAETETEWDERLTLRTDAAAGLGYWVGFDGDAFVGWWGASHHGRRPELAVLGWRLRRERWRQGYGVEGAHAVLAQAFAVPRVELVAASTMAVNTASRRLMERLGMVHMRTLHQEWDDPLPGSQLGEVVYEITRAAYQARSERPSGADRS